MLKVDPNTANLATLQNLDVMKKVNAEFAIRESKL